jgi:hypothetical protein
MTDPKTKEFKVNIENTEYPINVTITYINEQSSDSKSHFFINNKKYHIIFQAHAVTYNNNEPSQKETFETFVGKDYKNLYFISDEKDGFVTIIYSDELTKKANFPEIKNDNKYYNDPLHDNGYFGTDHNIYLLALCKFINNNESIKLDLQNNNIIVQNENNNIINNNSNNNNIVQNENNAKLTWDFWRSLFTSATALSFTTLMITAITAVILSQTGHLGHVAAYATLASVGGASLLSTTFFGGAELTLKVKDIIQGDKKDFIKNALSFCHKVENEKQSENYNQIQ